MPTYRQPATEIDYDFYLEFDAPPPHFMPNDLVSSPIVDKHGVHRFDGIGIVVLITDTTEAKGGERISRVYIKIYLEITP